MLKDKHSWAIDGLEDMLAFEKAVAPDVKQHWSHINVIMDWERKSLRICYLRNLDQFIQDKMELLSRSEIQEFTWSDNPSMSEIKTMILEKFPDRKLVKDSFIESHDEVIVEKNLVSGSVSVTFSGFGCHDDGFTSSEPQTVSLDDIGMSWTELLHDIIQVAKLSVFNIKPYCYPYQYISNYPTYHLDRIVRSFIEMTGIECSYDLPHYSIIDMKELDGKYVGNVDPMTIPFDVFLHYRIMDVPTYTGWVMKNVIRVSEVVAKTRNGLVVGPARATFEETVEFLKKIGE